MSLESLPGVYSFYFSKGNWESSKCTLELLPDGSGSYSEWDTFDRDTDSNQRYTGTWSLSEGIVRLKVAEECRTHSYDPEAVDFLVLADYLLAEKQRGSAPESTQVAKTFFDKPIFLTKDGAEVKEFAESDFASALRAVQIDGRALQFASEPLRANKDLVLAAVRNQGAAALEYAAEPLRGDQEVVLAAIAKDALAYKLAHEGLQADPDVIRAAVEGNAENFRLIPAAARADKALALKSVKCNGVLLEFASEELQADREVAEAALAQSSKAIKFVRGPILQEKLLSSREGLAMAPPEVFHDKEQVLKLLHIDPTIVLNQLEKAASPLYHDKDVALAAVSIDGLKIGSLPQELQDDRAVAAAAIKQNAHAFRYGSQAIKADKELAIMALQVDGDMVGSLPAELKNDKDVALTAVRSRPVAFADLPSEMRNDVEVALVIAEQDPSWLNRAHGLLNDRAFFLQAVQLNVRALGYASQGVRNDREVVLAAIKKDKQAFQYASDSLQADPEILKALDG